MEEYVESLNHAKKLADSALVATSKLSPTKDAVTGKGKKDSQPDAASKGKKRGKKSAAAAAVVLVASTVAASFIREEAGGVSSAASSGNSPCPAPSPLVLCGDAGKVGKLSGGFVCTCLQRHHQSTLKMLPPDANEDDHIDVEASRKADMVLDSPFLRYARSHPKAYLRIVGHLLVMSEMIALMTPAIAMGIQV